MVEHQLMDLEDLAELVVEVLEEQVLLQELLILAVEVVINQLQELVLQEVLEEMAVQVLLLQEHQDQEYF